LATLGIRRAGIVILGRRHLSASGGDDAPQRAVESAAILFTVLLVFMEIRHAINGGDVYRDTAGPVEAALQVCSALAMAIGLERLRIRTGSAIHNISAILLTVYAGLGIVFGLLVLENPMLLGPIDVGGRFINLILLGYAMPAVLALLLSYAMASRRPAAHANTIAASALVLALSIWPCKYAGSITDPDINQRRRASREPTSRMARRSKPARLQVVYSSAP
ncbi:MAG TPA: DUF2339 domain-containing protein, partial [Rhodanobacteraceae bacterium]|nr:DUF2339 domain-containing protein [Rhodanobacteraceae bacterium]